mgnify:CR=1 FL=1
MVENNESKFGMLLSEFLGVSITSLGPIPMMIAWRGVSATTKPPIDLGSDDPPSSLTHGEGQGEGHPDPGMELTNSSEAIAELMIMTPSSQTCSKSFRSTTCLGLTGLP